MSDDANDSPTPKPPKVQQSHGGAIYQGGVPGNRGGGRHPSAIRAAFREELADSLPILQKILKGRKSKHAIPVTTTDKIRAIEVLARVGLSETINRSDAIKALEGTEEDLRTFLAPMVPLDKIEELLAMIMKRWMVI